MIGPVDAAFRQALAPLVAPWPLRGANEPWPDGTPLSPGDLPVDAQGAPAPFAEWELIAGANTSEVGPGGVAHQRRSGLLRVYLCVALGSGTSAITTLTDALVGALQRRLIWADPSRSQALRCWDVLPDDNLAGTEDDNRFVRQLSAYWTFDYL